MIMRSDPVRSVVVVGGGIAGWCAAAALKRRLPRHEVTVVAMQLAAQALSDRMVCTLPSVIDFHEDLGLAEVDTVVRAGSSFRLGTCFEGWADDRPDYVHAYGECSRMLQAAGFHQHWVRTAHLGLAEDFHLHCPAAVMAQRGRFARPDARWPEGAGRFAYGLHIEPARYRELMRAYALHLGATERTGNIAGIGLRGEDGFIEAVHLDDGGRATADLFVDASGPSAVVRSCLDAAWDDWSKWLPCDRILFAKGEAGSDAQPIDRAIALAAGWRWEAPAADQVSRGLVYCGLHLSDTDAAQTMQSNDIIELRQGKRPQPWLRNCVAVGEAAVTVEPLEWTNLHLALSAIDRLIAMMPAADCSPVELADYNRQAVAEADRVRDFVALHYATARRPEPFWTNVASAEPPDTLAHTLAQFRERGRLPFYEEETFTRDSWLAVLLGQGVIPRRVDPLTDLVSVAACEQAMAQMRGEIRSLVDRLPLHSDYLQSLVRQSA